MDINSCLMMVGKSLGRRARSAMAGAGGGEKDRKERKDMLKAGQSRGSMGCVNDVMHYKA